MSSSLHFGFELFKIGILSCAYSALVIIFINIIGKLIKFGPLNERLKNVSRSWEMIFKIIYGVLFIFMFTYWGDHGLGDDSYLPIGYFRVVNQSDEFTYVEDQHGTQLHIMNFTYDNNNLYAEAGKDMFGKTAGDYLVWDLKNNKWNFYTTTQYSKKNYPALNTFTSFNDQYQLYWNGWRFWFLP